MSNLSIAVLTTAAGLLILPTASAQQPDAPVDASQVVIVRAGSSGYQSRAIDLEVYNVGTPTETGGAWSSSGVNVYDDATLAGPGASGPVSLSAIELAILIPTSAPAGQDLYARFSFYPDHNSAAPSGSAPYSGIPVVTSAHILEVGGSFPTPTPVSALLDDTNVFGPGDRTMGVKVELFLDAALTQYANGWQVVRRTNLTAPFVVGSSDPFGWFSATTVTTGDISNNQRSGGTPTNNRSTYLVLHASYTCGTADFNGDGDFATDADIEAFFACLAGSCCPTCWAGGADFNADGDSATDADIEAFFRVLAGQPC